jgi:hypothetical protein
MAVELKLYTPALSTSIYDNVFKVDSTWINNVAEGFDLVDEEIILYTNESAVATIEGEVVDINHILSIARKFLKEEVFSDYGALQITLDNSKIVESLIYDGRLIKTNMVGAEFPTLTGPVPWTLLIKRHPLFEDSSPSSFPASGPDSLSVYGGHYDFTGGNVAGGDEPARIARLSIQRDSGSLEISDAWVGFKTYDKADETNIADFNPVLSHTAVGGTGTSSIPNASRYNNETMQCSFSSGDPMEYRCYAGLSPGSSNHPIMRGRYLALIAARVSSGTCAIQLKAAYTTMTSDQHVDVGPIVKIDSTTFDIYPLGYLQIPPFFPVTTTSLHPTSNLIFPIWVERLTGSGALDWDNIVLIPTDHIAVVNDIAYTAALHCHIVTRQDDKTFQYGGSWGTPAFPGSLSVKNWGLPPRATTMVVVTDEAGVNVSEDDRLDLSNATYHTRWRNFRV